MGSCRTDGSARRLPPRLPEPPAPEGSQSAAPRSRGAEAEAPIVNLLLLGRPFDVALRDVGLLPGALALARLAAEFESPVGPPEPRRP